MIDYLALAAAALGIDSTRLARQAGRRGSPDGADARRIAVALATEAGASRRVAASVAGYQNTSSASQALQTHADRLDVDDAYRAAFEGARSRLAATGDDSGNVLCVRRLRTYGTVHAALDGKGRTACGLVLPFNATPLEGLVIGPRDLIGDRVGSDGLHVGWHEVERFVGCGRCSTALRARR